MKLKLVVYKPMGDIMTAMPIIYLSIFEMQVAAINDDRLYINFAFGSISTHIFYKHLMKSEPGFYSDI